MEYSCVSMDMSAFPDIKSGGNSQIGKKRCRHDTVLSAKFGENVANGDMSPDMSPTCAAKFDSALNHPIAKMVPGGFCLVCPSHDARPGERLHHGGVLFGWFDPCRPSVCTISA